jgi:hypothetical protein
LLKAICRLNRVDQHLHKDKVKKSWVLIRFRRDNQRLPLLFLLCLHRQNVLSLLLEGL